MKASTIFSTIISMAAIASANSVGSASTSCSADQVISCCNPTSKSSDVGLLSVLTGPILSGSCNGIGASILDILNSDDTSSVCGSTNEVKCCQGDKDTGVLVVDADLQCSDIL